MTPEWQFDLVFDLLIAAGVCITLAALLILIDALRGRHHR